MEEQAAPYAVAMLRATRHPLLALDESLVVQTVNAAFCGLFQTEAAEVEGLPLYEVGEGEWDIPELHRLIRQVLSHETQLNDYRVVHTFKTVGRRVMLINADCIRRSDGGQHVLLAIEDVTNAEAVFSALDAEKEYAQNVVDTIHEGVLVLLPDLTVERANLPFYKTFEVDEKRTIGRRIFDMGNGQWDIPDLHTALNTILKDRSVVMNWEVDHTFERIGRRIFLLDARKLRNQDRILVVVRDVTSARAAGRREEALRRELQHRVKNMLANIQAMSRQIAKTCNDIPSFTEALDGRIGGMARSLDLIGRSPEEASVSALIRMELEAHGAEEGTDYRVHSTNSHVPADILQFMGLLIHELATNAIKYGALKDDEGFVDVSVEDVPVRGELRLQWKESGVPIREAPTHPGFGMRLIKDILPFSAGGRADIAFHEDGLECLIALPLPDKAD